MWQDPNSGIRRHKLMTKDLAAKVKPMRTYADEPEVDGIVIEAKLFSPYNGWTWYIAEMDAETGECFGWVHGFENEWGYFDLTELATTTIMGSVPAVERDLHWQPQTIAEIKART